MKKIPSFTIDHIHLLRGIYVSRKDEVGGETVTTFDVRMKEPNREPDLGQGALHTIEHLAATFLRNHPVWSDKIVYWGPMGCLTGNYLLMKGDLQSEDIVELMKETFRFIAEYEGEVPGATPRDCGNYLLQDLPIAKRESAKYLHEVLEQVTDANLHYPSQEEMSRLTFEKSKEYAHRKYSTDSARIHTLPRQYMFLEISKALRRKIQPLGK